MKNLSLFLILVFSLTAGLSCSKKEESLGPSANGASIPTYSEAEFNNDKAVLEKKKREATHLLGDLLGRAEVLESDLTFFENLLSACDTMLNKYGARFRFHGDSQTSSRFLVGKTELINYRTKMAKLYEEVKKKYELQENESEDDVEVDLDDNEEALEILEEVIEGVEIFLETEEA